MRGNQHAGPQPLALNPDKTFDLSHTYPADGVYTVTVTVTYRSATDVPLVGPLLGDVTLTESVTMHRETP